MFYKNNNKEGVRNDSDGTKIATEEMHNETSYVYDEVYESDYRADRGSQFELQIFTNEYLHNIGNGGFLRKHIKDEIKIYSPIIKDEFKEYSAQILSEAIENKIDWSRFWPERGPKLDGFGIGESKTIYVIEAKSHITESLGPCLATNIDSILLIEESLRKYVGSDEYIDSDYYQLANRLCLVNMLKRNGAKAKLVYICFANDYTHTEYHKEWVTSVNEWKKGIENIVNIFKNMRGIKDITWLIVDLNRDDIHVYKNGWLLLN